MKSVTVNLIAQQRLEGLSSDEKIQFILEEVKKGEILVLERGLTSHEQAQLIESTMKEVNPNKFIGIEMQGYREETNSSWLKKLLGKIHPPRMTVIGPADKLKTIHKDDSIIKTKVMSK
jgi:hypothetical protein